MPLWISIICIVAAVVIGAGAGIFLGIAIRKNTAEKEIGSAEEEAKKIVADAIKTAEARKKEVVLEGKDEVHRFRNESEKEISDRRKEVQRQERRIQQKEETLDKKLDNMERKEEKVNKKLRDADAKLEEVETLKKSQFEMLEKISGYTAEQAKSYLLSQLENELAHEKSVKIMEYTEQLKEEADDKARNIISLAIQRLAADQVSEATISVVPLPNDEMKGRIIGREGRNIRAIETLTGVDLIIDDTPSQTKYQRYATLRAIFRSPGQSVPQPIPIVSEDTAAHGVEKVIFKKLSHKGENKRGQLTATLELWEYIPQTITAKSGSSSGSGKSGGSSASNLKANYKDYLSNDRGKSPARDDADTTAAMNKVTAMPY